MTNQIATSNTQAIVGSFTPNELDTLKHTIAAGTTDAQFSLFVQTCTSSNLNPFLNQIYCIVYGGKMSIQVSVEGIQSLARKTEGYKGIDVELVHEQDEFNYNAATKEITHKVGFPRGKVIGGYAIAKRDGYDNIVTVMEVNEVDHMSKGNNKNMWGNYFSDMFKKHIIKRAAKLQYGIEIAEDEPINTSSVDNVPDYRKDITPNQNIIAVEKGEAVDRDKLMKDKWAEVNKILTDNNLEKAFVTAIVADKFNKMPTELTLQEVAALVKFVELEAKKVTVIDDITDFANMEMDFEN